MLTSTRSLLRGTQVQGYLDTMKQRIRCTTVAEPKRGKSLMVIEDGSTTTAWFARLLIRV